MSVAPPQVPAVEQEARLIALLRGQSVDCAGLMQVAPAAGVSGPVAQLLGDDTALAHQELAHQHGLYWLRRAGRALDGAGIPFMVLKGVPLSERYYRPGFLRRCGDIDLLLAPADFPRAQAAIIPLGYTPYPDIPVGTALLLGHHVHFCHPIASHVELHIRLQSFFGTRHDAGRFLPFSVSQTLSNGYTVRVLAPADDFVHLAAHAASHRWEQHRWLHDLVLLLERHPGLDWDAVARRTAQLRLWRAVLLTCAVLEEEWGCAVPLTSQVPARYMAARQMLPSLRRPVVKNSDIDKLAKLLSETVTCDGPMEKARFVSVALAYTGLRRLRELWS